MQRNQKPIWTNRERAGTLRRVSHSFSNHPRLQKVGNDSNQTFTLSIAEFCHFCVQGCWLTLNNGAVGKIASRRNLCVVNASAVRLTELTIRPEEPKTQSHFKDFLHIQQKLADGDFSHHSRRRSRRLIRKERRTLTIRKRARNSRPRIPAA